MTAYPGGAFAPAGQILNALPHPVLAVDAAGHIREANVAAEDFFGAGRAALLRQKLSDLTPFGSPVPALVGQAIAARSRMNEYRVDVGTPRIGLERIVDIHVAPFADSADVAIVLIQERTIADKMDRQLTHRGAARSISALGAVLAHEIKNPLAGIRGAAQLLEATASDSDRSLTRLICEEADRIVRLVNRMEAFSEGPPLEARGVNIHAVLDRVKRAALAGFARGVRFRERYDPSLPPVLGNHDQLVRVFMNLVKNAAESIGENGDDGEIELTTAFRPGVRLRARAGAEPVRLPLEICVRDNGPGVPADLVAQLFDPFVTTRTSGTGLGLALVAKIVGDHGGIVECDSHPRRTTFRVLMPMASASDGRGAPREA